MKSYIICHQLLGDALMCSPGIRKYKEEHPDEDITLITGPEPYQDIWDNNPYLSSVVKTTNEKTKELRGKWESISGCSSKWSEYPSAGGKIKGICLDAGVAFSYCNDMVRMWDQPVQHMTNGFANQLGVKIDSTRYDLHLTPTEIRNGKAFIKKYDKPVIICAALSTSCTSRGSRADRRKGPNKMLSSEVWNAVIEEMEDKFTFLFFAAPKEELIDVNAEWVQGLPIRKVASICKAAAGVVSIDSGIGHVSQAVGANIVSVVAAVPRTFTSVDGGTGKYYCVDHTPENKDNKPGITNVTPEEIITGIKEITT